MGLLGGIARTAVAAGTWTAVSNRVARRQARRWGQQDQSAYAQPGYAQPVYAQPVYAQPPPAAPPPPAGNSTVDALTKLAALHAQGVLSDEEFAAAKARVLGT